MRAITDAAASVVQTYQTDEFGVPTQTQGSSTQPFQYTGEPRDAESGFVYLRARVYDPQIGRFLQRDPFAGQLGAPITLHRFIYAHNNPITLVDPTGFGAEQSQQSLNKGIDCNDPTNFLRWFLCGTNLLVTNTGLLVPLDPLQRDALAGAAASLGVGPDDMRYATGGPEPIRSGGPQPDDWAQLSGMLREAASRKGNFGIGRASWEQADVLGHAWVGKGYRVASDGKTLVSADGLRQYRPPSYKPNLGKVQANLEWRPEGVRQWQGNAHIDIAP